MRERISEAIENHHGKAFWLVFLFIGIFVVAATFGFLFLDILVGLTIVALGIYRIGQELGNRKLNEKLDELGTGVNYLNDLLSHTNNMNKKIKNSYEDRFFKLDSKRTELDEKIEKSYRELARKIIDVENKQNELLRAFADVGKTLPDAKEARLSKKIDESYINLARRQLKIQNKLTLFLLKMKRAEERRKAALARRKAAMDKRLKTLERKRKAALAKKKPAPKKKTPRKKAR